MSDTNDDHGAATMSVGPQAVILFCLLGAAAAVLCAWAMFSRFYESPPPRDFNAIGNDGMTQAQYMRSVRLRNYEQIHRIFGLVTRKHPKPPTDELVSDQDQDDY